MYMPRLNDERCLEFVECCKPFWLALKAEGITMIDDLMKCPFGKLIRSQVIVKHWDEISKVIMTKFSQNHVSVK